MGPDSMVTEDGMAVTPLQPLVGAEVVGIDVHDLDERGLLDLRDLVLRYSVLVVRDQQLTPPEQSALISRIYPLAKMPGGIQLVKGTASNRCPEDLQVQIFSNAIPDAGVLWHTDTVFNPDPELFISQHAIVVPHDADGNPLGSTLYRSTAAAYDALSEEWKHRLYGLEAFNSYAYHLDLLAEKGLRRRAAPTKEQWEHLADTIQPVVRVHPITGRPCLYVSEAFTSAIVGMPEDESRAMLDFLFAHIARPEFAYTHEWREGDFVIWDNSVTQHRATNDYGDIPRRLHRCSTDGPIPVGIDGTVGGRRLALHDTPA